jgi:hypothetical protein
VWFAVTEAAVNNPLALTAPVEAGSLFHEATPVAGDAANCRVEPAQMVAGAVVICGFGLIVTCVCSGTAAQPPDGGMV